VSECRADSEFNKILKETEVTRASSVMIVKLKHTCNTCGYGPNVKNFVTLSVVTYCTSDVFEATQRFFKTLVSNLAWKKSNSSAQNNIIYQLNC
jgi:late competence protein required for DNA uptake (superfamily II DNA/RNA helicase)